MYVSLTVCLWNGVNNIVLNRLMFKVENKIHMFMRFHVKIVEIDQEKWIKDRFSNRIRKYRYGKYRVKQIDV